MGHSDRSLNRTYIYFNNSSIRISWGTDRNLGFCPKYNQRSSVVEVGS